MVFINSGRLSLSSHANESHMTIPTSHNSFEIDFEPIGRRVHVEKGRTLLDAARSAGVELVSICGGVGICEGCKIRLVDGKLSPPTSAEREILSEEEMAEGYRLACQATPQSDVKVDVPSESLTTPQRLQIEGQEAEITLNPPVSTHDLTLSPPDLEDLKSDVTRVVEEFKERDIDATFGLSMLKALPHLLRTDDWSVRFALRGSEVVGVLPRETQWIGLAVDIGTTKLAAYLVDLDNGITIAKGGRMNPQIAFGEDVISRIAYANKEERGREILQTKLIQELNDLVGELCQEVGLKREQVVEAVVVGNTVMHHLFSGLPVRQLGEAPYVPVTSEVLEFPAASIGLLLAPGAWVYMPPNIAGYVGADHVAMLIATRLWQSNKTVLAVDIGTNTEVTLAANGRLLSCSCASGPAFEGAHIQDGMRAAPGAIERVQLIEGEIRLQTIGGKPPVGICGSGIMDVVAEMLTNGLLDKRGVLKADDSRMRIKDGRQEFVLSPADENGHHQDIVITRSDVNEIQLAKGAIRSGIDILLTEMGLPTNDLEAVIVAGAFGTYIDIDSAIRVGMFPELPRHRFQQVGNAAGAGARDLLLSMEMRHVASQIKDRIEYVELTTHSDFHRFFMERLYF
jgi:uncharacterized 2Fe-2S/4Fe-4S cluster protein (DUF4445 family)